MLATSFAGVVDRGDIRVFAQLGRLLVPSVVYIFRMAAAAARRAVEDYALRVLAWSAAADWES